MSQVKVTVTLEALGAAAERTVDSEALKEFRENQLQVSQTGFAELLDVHWSTVNRWERGRAPIPKPIKLIVLMYRSYVKSR